MTRKWLRQKEETTKERKGEMARALFIRRFPGSPIRRFWGSESWHSNKIAKVFSIL